MLRNNIEEKLLKDDFVISSINGNSMSPFLNEHINRVVISKLNRDIHLYDIVLYKTNNKYVLHRVIGINDNEYVIRGDNRLLEEYIQKDKILGILIAYYSKDEYIEINDDINKKWYKRSKNTLLLRKIIRFIKNNT